MQTVMPAPQVLLICSGGTMTLPNMTLVDRADGGHLCVNPPREVWERGELSAIELTQWGFLVAASAQAMMAVLPQLKDGCINYWEAGNWALNDAAPPIGPKSVQQHRRVHMHLLGRSPGSIHPDWQWGEAPRFPDYANASRWAAGFQSLNADECTRVVARTAEYLALKYGLSVR
jgi:diadenosine tetraphosphate (Ap4A) HIT family hydrolase